MKILCSLALVLAPIAQSQVKATITGVDLAIGAPKLDVLAAFAESPARVFKLSDESYLVVSSDDPPKVLGRLHFENSRLSHVSRRAFTDTFTEADLIKAFQCLYDAILELNRAGKRTANVSAEANPSPSGSVFWVVLQFEERSIELRLTKGDSVNKTRDSVHIEITVP